MKNKKKEYINKLYGIEDEKLRSIRNSAPERLAHMQISQSTGKILQFLIQLSRSKYVLEIGTFVGYSSLWIARGLASRGTLYTIEKSFESHSIAKLNIANSDAYDRVLLFYGDATQILQQDIIKVKMDAVFIDGAKSEYSKYLDLALQYLKPGGLVIADNTLLFDTVYEEKPKDPKLLPMWEDIRLFNDRLASNEFFSSCLIPTNSGLSVAIKK